MRMFCQFTLPSDDKNKARAVYICPSMVIAVYAWKGYTSIDCGHEEYTVEEPLQKVVEELERVFIQQRAR